MSAQQQHNFGAGPCILPISVMAKASAAVKNWDGMGLSILEVSHRTEEFAGVMEKTEVLVRELLDVPEDYSVLFLQGGASTQFTTVPYSFLRGTGKKAAFLDTGFFAQKAISEARYFGDVEIVASSENRNYDYVPTAYGIPKDAAYLHLTSNNTIEGTQLHSFPDTDLPLVCDMSSDIFARSIDVSKFSLIYAGAQKNMGPAGMTLVIARNSFLDSVKLPVPAMWDYRVHRDSGSLYNTPPVFSIYTAMLNLMWLKEQGGVKRMEELNRQKSELLYSAIEKSGLFIPISDKACRSMMNVTFRCEDPSREKAFLDYASMRGIVGIKGFSSRGGFRVSLYNALPLHSVEFLVKTMEYFAVVEKMKRGKVLTGNTGVQVKEASR